MWLPGTAFIPWHRNDGMFSGTLDHCRQERCAPGQFRNHNMFMDGMRAFAQLLDRLSLTASRNAKLTLVRDFLAQTPDPDRGWALAALTGNLTFKAAKPAAIRAAVEARMDGVLFAWSYDYVGDLAETVALVWPARPGANREPELSEVVDSLAGATRLEAQALIEGWLDALDADVVGLLGNQRLDVAGLELLDLVRPGVEADHLDLARLAGLLQPGGHALGSEQVGGEHALQVGVFGQRRGDHLCCCRRLIVRVLGVAGQGQSERRGFFLEARDTRVNA